MYLNIDSSGVRNGSQDLVIDDNVEGETLLGSGKAGLMDREDPKDSFPTPQRLQGRPISAKKKGLSGPITSNLEVSMERLKDKQHTD